MKNNRFLSFIITSCMRCTLIGMLLMTIIQGTTIAGIPVWLITIGIVIDILSQVTDSVAFYKETAKNDKS